MKYFISLLLLVSLSFAAVAEEKATQPIITSLDQLLAKVHAAHEKEKKLNAQREAEFLKEKNRQELLLAKARASYYSSQSKNNPARAQAEANELDIMKLRKELLKNVADMGDIYAVYNQFATDFKTVLTESQVGAQFPQRAKELETIYQADKLPNINDMERLWILTLEEMNESGKAVKYEGAIVNAAGDQRRANITRLGNFSAFSEDEFLRFVPETQEFIAPKKQPEPRFRRAAENYSESTTFTAAPVDPTRGNLLGILSLTPNIIERVHQAGIVGYMTITMGMVGIMLTIYRIIYLIKTRLNFDKQLADIRNPRSDNALGRIILSAQNAPVKDEENVQYVLDEAVLKEIPRLEFGHTIIKLFAALGPMLGLLGTVTGMIKTFEAISLFGGGDPKLMAAGISEALVNTVLGLLVAVPMLLSHNFITSLARNLIQRLDEQSAGILARALESKPPKKSPDKKP